MPEICKTARITAVADGSLSVSGVGPDGPVLADLSFAEQIGYTLVNLTRKDRRRAYIHHQ
jgi:hypothetical protein